MDKTSLSAEVRREILDAVKTSPDRTEWLLTGEGMVYSLALNPVKRDERPNVQVKLEEMARTQAAARVKHLMFLYAVPRARRDAYRYEDSMAEALASWNESLDDAQRLQFVLSMALVDKNGAFALAAAKGGVLERFSTRIEATEPKTFDTAYCASLYPKARALFDAQDYASALPVYRELHRLRWARPVAYLDAAECFLREGAKEDAAQLIEETLKELELDSAQIERAGDLLLGCGREALAEELYRRAQEKMRQEP